MMKNLLKFAANAALVLGLSAGRAHGRGENTELYVVPAPAAVVIDGSLDDWDLSGYVTSYVIPETRETQSARIAMMYDDEALYIGGVVRDSSPMMNRHDPLTSPTKAWDADVCQIFFSLDPDAERPLKYSSFEPAHRNVDVATFFVWYFTDRQEPAIAMFRGMGFTQALRPDLHENGHIPAAHFDAAYRKGEDGLEYTFEYRIPWSTLPMKRVPKANDQLAAAVAVFWSRPDGLKTAGGAAWAWNVMSKPGFAFQSAECWGTLKFAPEGNIPREWVVGHLPPEKPLPLTFNYQLPREGECTIQLFNEANESVRILVAQQRRPEGVNSERWDGLDDHGKPLPAGSYAWRGQVHDPIKPVYRFSVHNSGQPPYPTDDNKGGWGGDHGTPQAALALPDGMILAWNVCEYGWGVIRTDVEGKKQWGTKYNAEHLATDGKRLFIAGGHSFSDAEGVNVIDLVDSRPLNFQQGMPSLLPPPVAAPVADDSEVKPDGDPYGFQSTEARKAANVVTGLACDGERIYVSYRGRDRIAVHDLAGNLTAQWTVPAPGRLALRPDGSLAAISGKRVVAVTNGEVAELVKEELEAPRSVAVAPDGTMYVAQAGAAQQVRVYAADGAFLRTIGRDGGRPAIGKYDPAGIYEPGGIAIDAKGRLWVAETADGPKRISVWDTRTGENLKEFFGGSGYFGYGYIDPVRPDEFYAHHVIWKIDWDKYGAQPMTTFWRKTEANMMEGVNACGYNHGLPLRAITAANGVQYMWGQTMRHKTVLQRREGDLYKPFAAILHVGYGWSLYRQHGIPLIDDDRDSYPNGRYFWQDTNNDQIVQPEELVRLPRQFDQAWFVWLDPDLSVYLGSGQVLRPIRITPEGQPVYDFAQAEKAPIGSYGWRDDEGYSYTSSGGTMVKRDAEGDALWSYSGIQTWHKALGLPISGPGRLWGMTGPMGFAGDYFGMMTYFGPNHIFTRDGGYVAAVLEDGRLGGRGAYEGQPEGQGGQFVRLDINGQERYFIIHGGQDSRVWEVMGLDTLQPLAGGIYQHTAEAAASARREFEQWEAAKAGHAPLSIVRGREALDAAAPVGKKVEGERSFEARAAYDDANLYVRYDVRTPHELVNAQPEDMLIFRGGNCLDLQLATDPDADPERKTPAPGDVRLLVTRRDGKPFAMLYRPKVAGFDGEPTVLRSPTGSESFDRIERTDRLQLDYTKTDSGFTALVVVPLELLGWRPQPGTTVKMDVGYIFGNAPGTRAAIRAYWNNNSFSANVVDDIPNESRLEPAEWGEAVVSEEQAP